jgi:urease accessory protein
MSQSSLLRLMMLMSPSFPVGGFAYSSGLEQAVAERLVQDAGRLEDWLHAVMKQGPVWNDAVLLAQAHKLVSAGSGIEELADLAAALAPSKERLLEQQNLGAAFIDAVRVSGLALPEGLGESASYPVAVGAVCAAQKLACFDALAAYLHAFASNQIQCAIRLGLLGQNAGVALLAKLEETIIQIAERASNSTLDDLGSSAIMADIMTMRHEDLNSRIFRT